MDKKEVESQEAQRSIRGKVIDLEVENKRVLQDIDKVTAICFKEVQAHEDRIAEMNIEVRQIENQKISFRREMEQTELELRNKLSAVEDLSRQLGLKEAGFAQQQKEFDEKHRHSMHENDQLQEQIERFNIERDAFDRKAQAIKQQGELDQLDSEKIGFFKANKERIRDELLKLKEGLEEEKLSLQEDRIKLSIYKQELKQREQAIEVMRFEYIQATSSDVRKFSAQANNVAPHLTNIN